jgi:DNA-binding transcriptional ArsR family regulator
MDHAKLASELLKLLRGRRSQSSFSRWLGYSSNVQYLWESGRAFPRAARFFEIAERTGHPGAGALRQLYPRLPPALARASLASPGGVAAFLADLKGERSVLQLSRATGQSRFTLARWLKGDAEPRLPDFLCLVDGMSLRLLYFLSGLVDPAQLPSAAAGWRRLEAARRTAYDSPWSHAVLRALELDAYRRLPRHEPGWLARRVGLTPAQEEQSLKLLRDAGQIRRRHGRFEVVEAGLVDTRLNPEAAQRLREFWAREAVERVKAQPTAAFAYNLFTVSLADLERIRALHRSYFRELRAIVAQSEPAEAVALVTMSLVELGAAEPSTR